MSKGFRPLPFVQLPKRERVRQLLAQLDYAASSPGDHVAREAIRTLGEIVEDLIADVEGMRAR